MRTLTFLSLCALLVLGFLFFTDRGESDNGPSLFGIPLVPPIFAQGGGSTLPDPQAGLSSYIRRDPSLIDFDTIIQVFDETVQNGENYIIGAINIPRTEEEGARQGIISVRVYVDTDGFIIAYLNKNSLASNMFRWYVSDPPADPLETVLSDALLAVTTAIGAPAPTDASWYHWNYPSATHFSAAAKKGVGTLYVRVPTGAVFSENPSYSWYGSDYLVLDSFGNLRVGGATEFLVETLGSLITPGTRHGFAIVNVDQGVDNNFLGVAVIYRIP